MTIHSAADFGYTTELPKRTVQIGDLFRRRVQGGIAEYQVTGHWRHGYDTVTLKRWVVEPDNRSLLAFVGGSDVFTRDGILADKYAA